MTYRSVASYVLAYLVLSSVLAAPPTYPSARSESRVELIHGVGVEDPYRWLEDSESDETKAWTNAQNELTRSLLDQFSEQRSDLRKKLERLYRVTTESAPRLYEDKLFFSRRQSDDAHGVIYVRNPGARSRGREILNPNKFSQDGNVALDWWHPSPDGELIAFGKSVGGSELSTLYMQDVETGTELALQIPYTRACDVAWVGSRSGFYYTRYPTPGTVPAGDEVYNRHVYYHRFGTEWQDDVKVFGEQTPKEHWNAVQLTSDEQFIVIGSMNGRVNTDLWLARVNPVSDAAPPIEHPLPFRQFKVVCKSLDSETRIDTFQDKVYIRTNYQAPRYRILVADADNPGSENWDELIPEQEGVIKSMHIANGMLVLHVLENAHSILRVYTLDGKFEHEIELPTLGSVRQISGRPQDRFLYYRFESFAYPSTVLRYNLNTKKSNVISRTRVRVVLDDYTVEQRWYASKDGTKVPMFVVKHKDTQADGKRPTLLYAYGGFNHSITPFFWRSIFPWLDTGGVFAVANIRGGGEFGREWHMGGTREKRQKSFDDFIAAGETLIADGITNANKLAIRGGSNGGLLVGAAMTQRPELFQAVICEVPLLDMIRYHQLEIARLWIPEFGDPDVAEDFAWLIQYSPYHRVRPGTNYPSTFIRTGLSDSRVDPMHARKMTALLQRDSASERPILIWVEPKAGHGKGKPMHKYIDDQVDVLTFLFWQLGEWE